MDACTGASRADGRPGPEAGHRQRQNPQMSGYARGEIPDALGAM